MKYFFLIYPLLYTIILVIGILNYSKIRNSFYLKLFLIFIGYSLLTEILGFVLGFLFGINTFPIYNTWNIVNHFFYLFFFLGLLKNSFKRNIVKIITVIYAVFTFINIAFLSDYINKTLSVNIIIGSTLIVIAIMIYFSELLQSDAILYLKKSLFFWISLGVLLFNIGFIPVFVIAEYISFNGVFRIITLLLNLLMSGCFITGFIVSESEKELIK